MLAVSEEFTQIKERIGSIVLQYRPIFKDTFSDKTITATANESELGEEREVLVRLLR
jgi:hypothetical protein